MASPVVDVYVKLPSGRTSVLNLMPTDLVKKINEQIGKEEGVPIIRVRIKYQGKILDKSKTIGYLGIRPETILKADFVVPKDIKIFVKVVGGGSAPVDIQTTNSLNDLKLSVERLDIVSPKKVQSFCHDGRTFRANETPLFETNIKEESVVEVSFQSETTIDSFDSSNIQEKESFDDDIKDAVLSSFQTDGKAVEVVFAFDTTGSMNSYLNRVRTNLRDTCKRLLKDIPNIRIGLIAHGDYCDHQNYVIKIQDLTTNVDELVDFAQNTPSTGGGDAPECYEWVLHKAQQLDWSEDSAKALIMIGDCEPHPPSYTDQKINWHTELDILKGMDVKVYGVFCNSTTGSTAENFYRELADRTNGCLLKLANFNLITEMFIGVCYRESNQEQLETFTEELKKDGKFNQETEDLLQQLEETKPKEEESSSLDAPSYLTKFNYKWWSFETDSGTPKYKYNSDTDSWASVQTDNSASRSSYSAPATHSSSSTETSSPISSSYISKWKKNNKPKGRCSIM